MQASPKAAPAARPAASSTPPSRSRCAATAYVMAIPKNTEFTPTPGGATEIKNWPERLSPNAWQRRSCGIGSKGYRVYDWAIIDTDRPDHQYMIRRSVDDGELAFYHCYNPRHEPTGELVRAAGTRWPIEECFQTGKGNVGLDNYQVRLYHAWYRHITLAMIAQSFLAVLAHRHHAWMLAAEARTPPVILRLQQSHDHGLVRASACSDTPPTSFAGRS